MPLPTATRGYSGFRLKTMGRQVNLWRYLTDFRHSMTSSWTTKVTSTCRGLLNQIWVLSPDGSQRILIANKENAPLDNNTSLVLRRESSGQPPTTRRSSASEGPPASRTPSRAGKYRSRNRAAPDEPLKAHRSACGRSISPTDRGSLASKIANSHGDASAARKPTAALPEREKPALVPESGGSGWQEKSAFPSARESPRRGHSSEQQQAAARQQSVGQMPEMQSAARTVPGLGSGTMTNPATASIVATAPTIS